MWWILIGWPPAFTPTTPIKTHHITTNFLYTITCKLFIQTVEKSNSRILFLMERNLISTKRKVHFVYLYYGLYSIAIL